MISRVLDADSDNRPMNYLAASFYSIFTDSVSGNDSAVGHARPSSDYVCAGF